MTRKPRLKRTSHEARRSIAATPRADFLLINGPEIYIKANQAGGGIGTKLPTRKHCREPPVEFCDREFSRAGNDSSVHHRRLPGMCLASGRGNIMIAMTISSSSLTTGMRGIRNGARIIH